MKTIIETLKFSFKKATQSYIVGACLVVYLLISSVAQAAFEGYISPKDAFNWASTDDNVYILDVRTGEEWMWVGHPGPNKLVGSKNGKAHGLNYNEGGYLEGKVVNIAYWFQKADGLGGLEPNPSFINDVMGEGFDPNLHILLVMCRSGGRANLAANDLANVEGFTTYNIYAGFQGHKNTEDYPGPDTGYQDVDGWVNEGLPWNQSKDGGHYSQ